jgi:hypothetical protein
MSIGACKCTGCPELRRAVRRASLHARFRGDCIAGRPENPRRRSGPCSHEPVKCNVAIIDGGGSLPCKARRTVSSSPAVPTSAGMDVDTRKHARATTSRSSSRLHPISRLGTTATLNQDRTAIYHNRLPSAESFLHQKQIGLRYVMSLADSANRETLSHAFV